MTAAQQNLAMAAWGALLGVVAVFLAIGWGLL